MNTIAIADLALQGSIYTLSAMGVGRMTKTLKPTTTAMTFGAVSFVAGKLIGTGFDQFFGNTETKILKTAGEYFGGLLVGLGYLQLTGVKLKLTPSLYLSLGTFALSYVLNDVALPMLKDYMNSDNRL